MLRKFKVAIVFAGSIVLDWTEMFRFRLQAWTSMANFSSYRI